LRSGNSPADPDFMFYFQYLKTDLALNWRFLPARGVNLLDFVIPAFDGK
jgi:hypothetical protein